MRGGFLRLVAPFFFFLASAPVAHVFIEKQPYDKQAEPDNGSAQSSNSKDPAQNQAADNQPGEKYDPGHVRVVFQRSSSLST